MPSQRPYDAKLKPRAASNATSRTEAERAQDDPCAEEERAHRHRPAECQIDWSARAQCSRQASPPLRLAETDTMYSHKASDIANSSTAVRRRRDLSSVNLGLPAEVHRALVGGPLLAPWTPPLRPQSTHRSPCPAVAGALDT